MKLRNVATVLGTATVTAVLTLALLAPWGAKAQAEPTVHPVIAQAQLASQGCTFSLTTDKTAYDAGQTPQITVKAVNPTDKPVTATVTVAVSYNSPMARMSRMLPMPTLLWSHPYEFQLGPDETKTLDAKCAALPALGNVTITLMEGNAAVVAGVYGVPGQQGQDQGNNTAAYQAALRALAAAQAGPNGQTPNGGTPVGQTNAQQPSTPAGGR